MLLRDFLGRAEFNCMMFETFSLQLYDIEKRAFDII